MVIAISMEIITKEEHFYKKKEKIIMFTMEILLLMGKKMMKVPFFIHPH